MAGLKQVLELFEAHSETPSLGAEAIAEAISEPIYEASRAIRLLWGRGLLDAEGMRGLKPSRRLMIGESIHDLTFQITLSGIGRLEFWRTEERRSPFGEA